MPSHRKSGNPSKHPPSTTTASNNPKTKTRTNTSKGKKLTLPKKRPQLPLRLVRYPAPPQQLHLMMQPRPILALLVVEFVVQGARRAFFVVLGFEFLNATEAALARFGLAGLGPGAAGCGVGGVFGGEGGCRGGRCWGRHCVFA